MKPVLILYATREGQTRRIARHLAASLAASGISADVYDVNSLPPYFQIEHYEAAILAASVHAGEHEKEMVEFAKSRHDELERLPTAFVSVSLAEAGAELPTATANERAKAMSEVRKMIFRFLDETAWHPSRVKPVAGALLYRQYNPFLRFVMKHIVARNGGDTDTSRDHFYTDWAALDRFVNEFVTSLGARSRAAAATAQVPTPPAA